jgi:hypothetical protein
MECELLYMADDKRYNSYRLYNSVSEPETQEDPGTCTRVQPHSLGVGSNSITMGSRREQLDDSRLLVSPDHGYNHLEIFIEVVGLAMVISAIWANIDNWKAATLFVLAFIYLVGRILKMMDCDIKVLISKILQTIKDNK